MSPIAGRKALQRSKTAEGSLGHAPRGRACDYIPATCPVAVKIDPDILGRGTETPLYFFGIMWIPLAFWLVQNIAKIETRDHLDGLAECFARVDTF